MLHMCNARSMPKMIQVRNVPDRLHRELMRRARESRKPLTLYVQELLEREVARPRQEEVFERIASRSRVELGGSAARLIRLERAASKRS